jgi:hypothetical protein
MHVITFNKIWELNIRLFSKKRKYKLVVYIYIYIEQTTVFLFTSHKFIYDSIFGQIFDIYTPSKALTQAMNKLNNKAYKLTDKGCQFEFQIYDHSYTKYYFCH